MRRVDVDLWASGGVANIDTARYGIVAEHSGDERRHQFSMQPLSVDDLSVI
jgi:hypothetical protein